MVAFTFPSPGVFPTATETASKSPGEKRSLVAIAYLAALPLVMMPWLGFLGYTTWQMVHWLAQ